MSFPLSKENQSNLESRNISVTRIDSENIRLYSDTNRGSVTSVQSNPPRDPSTYSYFVGPGDELRVQTWSSPERKNLSESSSIPNGPTVNEKGEFFHPFVGMVTARGKTVTEIQQGLEKSLVQYIADPQVEVDVRTFRAHSVTLVGEVESPGSTVLTNVPLRLLDIINTAGTTQISDLRRVEVRRKGTTYTTNLRSFIDHGAPGHNPILLPDDLVYVPIIEDNKVFVFGEIGTGEVVLGAGRRSLTEILAAQGGIDRTRADARGVFVFRRPPGQLDGFNVYQFDLSDASALMLTSQFHMAPMDVVFVTTDPISRWNDTVGKLISPVTGVVRAKAIVSAFES
ncbi:MAG: polysaccharide biosynthesis/export family protein [Rhodobacterales bacterium]